VRASNFILEAAKNALIAAGTAAAALFFAR
jgi:hypothetical protein